MTLRCENCGQVVQPTDAVCWQCGWKLSLTATDVAVAGERPSPITAVLVYAALTLGIIVLLLLGFRALGRYPLVMLDPKAPIKPGWTFLTDQRQTFTLEIPPGWTWREDDLNGRFADWLAEHPPVGASLYPWNELVGDLEIMLVADNLQPETAEQVPGFVLVTRSYRLAQLTPEQMTAVWRDSVAPENLLAVAVATDLRGQAKGTAVLTISSGGDEWVCRQEGVAGRDGRYLLIACLPAALYEAHAREHEILLSSFQLLLPPS